MAKLLLLILAIVLAAIGEIGLTLAPAIPNAAAWFGAAFVLMLLSMLPLP